MTGTDLTWRDVGSLLSSHTFTICLFIAVLGAAILAFVFGADLEIVAALVILGAVTAIVETRVRAKEH